MTPEQHAAFAEACLGLRRARRAAGVATFSGWTLALFGAFSVLGGIWDPFSLGVGIALCVLAWSEFKGASAVRAFRPRGSRRLVLNQLAILGMILVYAGVGLWNTLSTTPPGLEPTGEAQVDRVLGDVAGLTRMIGVGIYGSLLALGVPLQLLMAAYHARRGRQLARRVEQTPTWIVDLARAA